MSLINDALQRARDEAVRRQAARKRVPLPPVRRHRELPPWLVGAVLILALALVVSLVLLATLTSRLTPASAPRPAATDAGDPVVAAGERPRPDRGTLPGGSTAEPISQTGELVPTAAIGESSVAGRAAVPAESVATEALPSNDAVVGSTLPVVPDQSAEVYSRRAQLADGVSFELGGIAWSESGPYALLNGRVVGVGEAVRGFLVREIDPQKVVLDRDGQLVVIRLK